ncbi:Linear gramicidin dehydrogenase LgrE [Clostridiales bacterium CHKCI001]|nr:Linear gramicidin dehydrogenase LgrE [Clostridiales bacterium CHKCI001]
MEKLIKNREKIHNGDKVLFCFPFAGGGAAAFNSWVTFFATDTVVCTIQLPGREERIMEKPYTDMRILVEDLYKLIHQYDNHQLYFFGHSMGAKIAYEVAKKLESEGKTLEHLIVSGSRVPHLPEQNPIYHLNDEEFEQGIARFDGTPQEILENKELMSFFLPMLRADFIMDETYYTQKIEKLSCPITALGGTFDKEADEHAVLQWKEYALKNFQAYFFEGGHFFIREKEQEVLKKIAAIIMDKNENTDI